MRLIQSIVILTIVVLLSSIIIFRLTEKVYDFDNLQVIKNFNTYDLSDKNIFRISVELVNDGACYTNVDRDGNIELIESRLKFTQLVDINYSVSGNYNVNLTCCNVHNQCDTELFNFTSDGINLVMD